MRSPQKDFQFEPALQLKDAGLVAADAAATVASAAKELDLGAARTDGRVIVDVTAIEVADGNERFLVKCQFSNTSGFGAGIVGGPILEFGDSSVTKNSADSTVGRYELPFTNEVNGVIYRYMRLWTECDGTVGTGINYSAFAVTP